MLFQVDMGLSLHFLTLLYVVFLLSFSHLAVAGSRSMRPLCHDDERSALLQFKGSLSFNSTFCWLSSDYPKVAMCKWEEENSDCCSWDGVMCNEDTGHVIKLDLADSWLHGSINSSSSLFRLVHLKWLSLAYNDFNDSQIPTEIMNLSMLSHLNLTESSISGQIPSEILELSKLETLDLSYNFNLKLPESGLKSLAEKLTNLKKLVLDDLDISSSIPRSLANLSSLTYLSLYYCNLHGEFPAEMFQLPNLYHLSVEGNLNLSGYLPEFDKEGSLKELILSGTGFFGEIPKSIENLKSLLYLDISYCSFRGTLPSSMGNLTQLRHLSLSRFMFPGELPTFMGNFHSLQELDISACNLSGQLPSSIVSNLSQLNILDISDNYFSGGNPLTLSWISKLTKLMVLRLQVINFIGEIPSSFQNLTQLTFLDMASNQLIGPLPHWLMNLSQLRYLYLSSNQLTGPIPTQVKNLTQLIFLDLSLNRLQGSIPSFIFELESLIRLDLSSNNLNGTIELDKLLQKPRTGFELNLSSNKLTVVTKSAINPSSRNFFWSLGLRSCNLSEFPSFIRNQVTITALDLSSNFILGEIPGWFLNVSINSLFYLNLSHNLLTGFDEQLDVFLPSTRLATLDLRNNKFQGSIPISIALEYTTNYLISNNNFTGKIPSLICDLHCLHVLDLSNNKFSGVLPQCLGNFSEYLVLLKLQNNKFHGSIPQTFMNGTQLKMIDLSGNLLEGKIPISLANCTKLEFLNLGDNQITDIFPSWLGTLPKLQVLLLQSNKFHGVIKDPEIDSQFPKLRIIDLSHNKFTGQLPSKYFQHWKAMEAVNKSQLTYMQYEMFSQNAYDVKSSFCNFSYSLTLSNKGQGMKYEKVSNLLVGILLSNNEFTGEIPVSIVNLNGLQNLNLSNNNLTGEIPSSLGNLKELESFDLSNNMFSGEIPRELAELTTLSYFNVSYNHLKGPIPEGTQFDTFPNSSFEGNPGLCGKYVSRKCSLEDPQEEDQGFFESSFEFDWKIVLIGYGGGMIAGVALGHVFITTGKHEWFLMNFERLLKKIKQERAWKLS